MIAYLSLGILFVMSALLFYRYIFSLRTSDFPAHIKNALNGKGYSLAHILFILCYRLSGTKLTIVVLMGLVTVLTALACAWFMKKYLDLIGVEKDLYSLIPVSASSVFICKLCVPEWSPLYYDDSFATQPWHNSTYILMRLFGICCFVMFYLMQKDYQEKIKLRDCALFTLFLILVNCSKPNFIIAFSPIMLLMLIYDFVRSRGKTFKNAFLFGLCVLISCAVLLYQYAIVFPSNGNDKVILSLANGLGFIGKDNKFVLHLLLNLAFPLYVSVLYFINRKKMNDLSHRMFIEMWAMFVLSFLEFLFVVESGSRAADGNFEWGLSFFAYMLFMTCYCYLIKFKQEGWISGEQHGKGTIIYNAHVLFGLFYFGLLVIGYLSWVI